MSDHDDPPLVATEATVLGADYCTQTGTGLPRVVLALDFDGATYRAALPLGDARYLLRELARALDDADADDA